MIRKASEIDEQTPWQEMTVGGEIYEGGTALLVNTGDWRTITPEYHGDKCKHCMLCFPFCPDSAIPVVNGKRQDFDLMHCKGCGICAKICPFHAISFGKEGN
jgi:pyruvate ferredoxin oxidoreductase delta subunit